MASLGKELVVRQIAKDLFLREDVVEEVIDRFIDVAVEEVVNKGEFKVHRLFSISSVDYKAYVGGKGEVPAHTRLKIRLSEGVHRLFKMQAANPGLTVTRDNWRSLLNDNPARSVRQKPTLDNVDEGDLYNPLLDED